MPRVRPRKEPCDCDRCVDKSFEELLPLDPALTRSLVLFLTQAAPFHTDHGVPERERALRPHQQQHLDKLVQEGCSGTLYFNKLEGGRSEQFLDSFREAASKS